MVTQEKPRVRQIALVGGYWSTNLGNSFFNLGGKHALEKALPDAKVAFVGDQPAYWTFRDQRKGNPQNDLGFLDWLDVDYLVCQGPLFTVNFEAIWGRTIREIEANGGRVVYLGSGLFKYSKEEVSTVRAFLEDHPPHLLCSRDHKTYELLGDLARFAHSGIDSAFFLPEVVQPLDTRLPPYIIMAFDRIPEPRLRSQPRRPSSETTNYEWRGERWSLEFSAPFGWLAKQSKGLAYLGAGLDFRSLPSQVGKYMIVRTEHRYNPMIWTKVYRRPNTHCLDFPYTYINLYANAELVITDRVHAAAAALAYGREVMFFSPTPRGSLLARVGAGSLQASPGRLDLDALEQAKAGVVETLRGALV